MVLFKHRPSPTLLYTPRDLVPNLTFTISRETPSAPTTAAKQLGAGKASNQQALVSVASTVVWLEVEVVALKLTDRH